MQTADNVNYEQGMPLFEVVFDHEANDFVIVEHTDLAASPEGLLYYTGSRAFRNQRIEELYGTREYAMRSIMSYYQDKLADWRSVFAEETSRRFLNARG